MKHAIPLALAVSIAACEAVPQHTPPVATAPSVAAPAASITPACSAHDTLDGLDARKPIPLLPHMAHHQKQQMRDHLGAVQDVVAAAAVADFTAVERAAARIGYSASMGAMCTHMGAGAPGFSDQAIAFHKTADSIAAAARKRDRDGVLAALAATLATCTGRHAAWKQHVVDPATHPRVASGGVPRGH